MLKQATDPTLSPVPDSAALAAPPPQTFYAWLVLVQLMLVYSFSWMDRFLLVILIDPISKDLHVSNTQIGLLTGFGASLLYSLAGFPIARMADRKSRSTIISSVLGLWSGLTAATALAGSFLTLAATRFGIAIASAGCSPAAYSLISDYFPARRRGTAIAIYSLGISIGTWAGLSLGGFAADSLGWRTAFLILGLPGVAFALFTAFAVKEPVRGRYDGHADETDRHYSAAAAASFFLRNRTFLAIAFGFGFISCATSAFENWIPTYLIRAHHLSATEVGTVSGLFQGLTGIFGALGFGILADRLARRSPRWYLWIPLICALVAGPLIVLFFQLPKTGSYVCYFLIELCVSGYSAPLFAAGQMLLPPRLRALGMATILFVLNVVGQGLGPFLTGLASDLIGGSGGAGGLGPAIMLMQAVGLLGAAALVYAGRTFRKV
ncbi:spinster family MFS transporter [Novosphingobium naphthalenivorans]|uniref:spinster family MFS transporter n=1 Tax=Novosphingobium naphthalenivorans TaxID=273168 RepID=UPI000836D34D|nr:MFS transporter [Novosphingobium naphthalenivorans]